MNFYKVRVDCWYEYRKPKAKVGTPPVNKKVTRWFIVQADDIDASMAIAKRHAEDTAAMGPRWIGFEDLESGTVKLPLEIKP